MLFCHSDLKMVEKIIKNININIYESQRLKTMKLGVLRIDDIFASLTKEIVSQSLISLHQKKISNCFQRIKW